MSLIIFLIFFVLHPISVFSQCLDDQKSLLMALKNDLVFDSSLSTKLVGWNESLDCCRWPGIECNGIGQVTGLDLNNETIEGVIDDSSSLFGLRFLKTLNLAYNYFSSAQLPSGFEKFPHLSSLNLSNANFEGQIPIEFSQMTKLVTLDLSSSIHYTLKLENPDLEMLIRNLTKLRELHLDNIKITTNGHNWCNVISSSLPSLQVLSLRGCSLSGPMNSSLAKLKHLSVIILDENAFASPVPEFFVEFQNLTVLSLRQCKLNGSFPKKIFQVSTLKTIDLSSNIILEGPLPEFPTNGSLENLVLSYTEIGGKLPDSVGRLRMLSRIELNGCKFIGSLPNSMQNLSKLVYVNLASNKFISSIPSFHLSKGLTWLNLYDNNLAGEIHSSHWEGLDNLEFLDLGSNFLVGKFPESLLTLPLLRDVDFSNNKLSGQISNFVNISCYKLYNLDLSNNRLEGPMPRFIFKLPRLSTLSLSGNNFTGTVELGMFGKLKNLYSLDLSCNDFSVNVNTKSSIFSSLFELNSLKLASCKMQELPDLKNQSRLMKLDLSDNNLSGEIPNWIWEIGNGFLRSLNLSHNNFLSLQKPYTFPFLLDIFDLHSNNLKGDIPIPPRRVYYLDFSNNNFGSSIPFDFGNVLTSTYFFSISNSKVVGVIPESICNASSLNVLDLSNNDLNGTIPPCLAETSKTLRVLNIRKNKLNGNFLGMFPQSCKLETLDLSGNHLQGPLARSLVNCSNLEVLNLGENMIMDTFPCYLNNLSNLRVLVIRNNNFSGQITCLGLNNWTNIQIIDIASNRFSGVLPQNSFLSFMAIDNFVNQSKLSYLNFQSVSIRQVYYQDSVTVVFKGQSRELVKILTIFTSMDFSSNSFQGSIPDTVGDLKWLRVLNFSHNSLTGPIPVSIGKLENLESLDLSVNNLSGNIPNQVASLTFISFLNLSYNHLSGRIPRGSQFQTFTEESFKGNQGLCGIPLNTSCQDATSGIPKTSPSTNGDLYDNGNDFYISAGLGFLVGFLVIVGPLAYIRRLRTWYNNHVDRILSRISQAAETKDKKSGVSITTGMR